MTCDKLIVALDVDTPAIAQTLVEDLGDIAGIYKIGYQLIPIGGLALAEQLSLAGKKVFLDFKFHDIGATVERGVRSICALGADFLTVHATPDVIKGAVDGRGDDKRLRIFAVTVLTSIGSSARDHSGGSGSVEDLVLQRAGLAAEFGADGVIASANEAAAIKKRFGGALKIITPGIRPAGISRDDQKRVASPAEAIRAGADYLVVGRPIIAAANPRAAARAVAEEIAHAQ